MKNFGEKGAWACPGTAHFLGTPYYLRNGESYRFQIWPVGPVHSEGPSEQKPIKNVREKGLPNFFGYPLLSRERGKLQILNLANTFRGSIRTKPIKNFRENGAWAIEGLPNFFGYPLLCQERGNLQISN